MRGRGGGKKRGTFPQKRGGGPGRGGLVSHKNVVRVGRSSQPHAHADDDDVILVDEEGNDQAQQPNADLRSVLNERR